MNYLSRKLEALLSSHAINFILAWDFSIALVKNADDFELERYKQPTSKHLALRHGAHHCIGSNLARREGRIAF